MCGTDPQTDQKYNCKEQPGQTNYNSPADLKMAPQDLDKTIQNLRNLIQNLTPSLVYVPLDMFEKLKLIICKEISFQ